MMMTEDAATQLIGGKLRALRKATGWTLRDLSERSGTSIGILSNIENGLANPSVMTMQNIATAFDVPVHYFFDLVDDDLAHAAIDDGENQEQTTAVSPPLASFVQGEFEQNVVRFSDRESIELEGGVTWRRLTPSREHGIQFLEVLYEVGASSGPSLTGHAGRECAMVLSGEMTLEIEDDKYVLKRGDTMTFDSTRLHRVSNSGNQQLRVFWSNYTS